ncbi:MAG: hemerythrin family protein [Oscillospiraceae bacterium]|nr:hemerythrin family protein [Oscillospiraceae bacterium]
MSSQKYGIAWDDRFKIGNYEIDEQHRKLFEALGEIISYCENNTDADKLHITLDYLVQYTVQHFHDEEAVQVRYGYPEYHKHKQLHEAFKETVGGLVSKFDQNGSSAELSSDVNKVIVHWIASHILGEDKKIGAHIQKATSR